MGHSFEPPKRIYKDIVTDSGRWEHVVPRAGDIVVSTPPKSGTTWTQAIIGMLIADDPEADLNIAALAPWVDSGVRDVAELAALLEAQTGRRQVKTHTGLNGIPYWPEVRYVTVYRHPIDVHFSFRDHVANMNPDFFDRFYPDDISEGFRKFLEGDHFDAVSLKMILTHYRETLAREPRENLLRLHYMDMIRDPRAAVSRIAEFTGFDCAPPFLDAVTEATRFDSMRANAHRFVPGAGKGLWRNEKDFFHASGTRDWRDRLTADDLAAYDARVDAVLTPEERRWLEQGGTV